MRRPASEKMAIIQLVEESDLGVHRTLKELGVPKSTFYDWYRRFLDDGIDGLEDGKPQSRRQWNKIPERIRTQVLHLALERTALSPRELAWAFTDTRRYFVSESSVYRLVGGPLLQKGDIWQP